MDIVQESLEEVLSNRRLNSDEPNKDRAHGCGTPSVLQSTPELTRLGGRVRRLARRCIGSRAHRSNTQRRPAVDVLYAHHGQANRQSATA